MEISVSYYFLPAKTPSMRYTRPRSHFLLASSQPLRVFPCRYRLTFSSNLILSSRNGVGCCEPRIKLLWIGGGSRSRGGWRSFWRESEIVLLLSNFYKLSFPIVLRLVLLWCSVEPLLYLLVVPTVVRRIILVCDSLSIKAGKILIEKQHFHRQFSSIGTQHTYIYHTS